MSGDKERALAAGFDGYLSKPISVRSLLNDLRATVEQTALQRAMAAQTPAPGQSPNQFLTLADQPDQPAKPAQVQEQKKS
jgi:DNA-binding response OmpR family regulator